MSDTDVFVLFCHEGSLGMGSADRLSSGAALSATPLLAAQAARLRPAQFFFALSMIALGVLGLIYGDVALVWQRIPIDQLPRRQLIAYALAVIELAGGVGLLFASTVRAASGVLFVFVLLWAVLLKVPAVVLMPSMEAMWLGLGEITVILAGAWVLFASTTRRRDGGADHIRVARLLFGVSLPMIGLSHFFYSEPTLALVPEWLPYRLAWVYLTGAASLAACIGVLFAVAPRLASTLEAAMLWIITLLVWGPAIVAAPTDRTAWTAFVISAAIACGAWLVADSYRSLDWLAAGARAQRLSAR